MILFSIREGRYLLTPLGSEQIINLLAALICLARPAISAEAHVKEHAPQAGVRVTMDFKRPLRIYRIQGGGRRKVLSSRIVRRLCFVDTGATAAMENRIFRALTFALAFCNRKSGATARFQREKGKQKPGAPASPKTRNKWVKSVGARPSFYNAV